MLSYYAFPLALFSRGLANGAIDIVGVSAVRSSRVGTESMFEMSLEAVDDDGRERRRTTAARQADGQAPRRE